MKMAVFGTKKWVRNAFSRDIPRFLEVTFFETDLNGETARLADGFDAVCVFVNDVVDRRVVNVLADHGVRVIALRCAGFNNVDLLAARNRNIMVCRVPEYSPYAVAEHALGLILSLNRKFHRAHARVREGNFALDGLLGFDIHGKTVGVIGTGKIGQTFITAISGFGVEILAHDLDPSREMINRGVEYTGLENIYRRSDIISLHCPLNAETFHLISDRAVGVMKPGVMIINTSRGALVDTGAVIRGLKSGIIGYLGLDVYEEEGELFFEDLSDEVIQDDTFVRLQTFPNVLITSHQAFFTAEAVESIRQTTLDNLKQILDTGECDNKVEFAP